MSVTDKAAMLARIHGALAGAAPPPPVPHDYRVQDTRSRAAILDELVDRLLDYHARVTRTTTEALPATLTAACEQLGIRRLVVPADVPAAWLPAGITALRDDPPLTVADLDNSDGVLTGCAGAIAQTGTIILDGGVAQGRRALSLVPDRHLCVVYAEQVVGLVPEAIAALAGRTTQPLTLISGPSATSDIELSRVEGVHGPRLLHVLLVSPA